MPEFNAYKVVGFDLRQAPILDLGRSKRLGEHWPTDHPIRAPFPPTISKQTWPRSPSCENLKHPETNSLGLLWLPDAQTRDCSAISVAFSISNKDAEMFDADGWIMPIDEGHLSESFGWEMLGYDVADAWLEYSGFYGSTFRWRGPCFQQERLA